MLKSSSEIHDSPNVYPLQIPTESVSSRRPAPNHTPHAAKVLPVNSLNQPIIVPTNAQRTGRNNLSPKLAISNPAITAKLKKEDGSSSQLPVNLPEFDETTSTSCLAQATTAATSPNQCTLPTQSSEESSEISEHPEKHNITSETESKTKKFTFNPNAKEFNPGFKSFTQVC